MSFASRRSFLQKSSLLSGILLSGQMPGLLPRLHGAEPAPDKLGHGNFQYRLNREWAALNPAQTPVFNCHEMVMDSAGRLIFITDETRNNIIILDRSGKLIDSWGHRWPGGHGLTLSPEGDEDFLFIVDCGWFFDFGRTEKWQRQSGTIAKTTLDGKIVFTLGHPQTVGTYTPDMTYQPTEVAVAPNGDIYVADGYGSDYILHYDAQGQFIRKFGGRNNANPQANLHNAHGVAVDIRDPAGPQLICTSRSENCFKVFSMEGHYLKTIPLPGAFVCRPVIRGNHLYAGVCWSKQNGTGPRGENSGFVTILDQHDRVVSNPGGNAPTYTGEILNPIHQTTPVFHHCHDVCVDPDENLYVCQWNANKVYPYQLARI